jgi:hypothetical protein
LLEPPPQHAPQPRLTMVSAISRGAAALYFSKVGFSLLGVCRRRCRYSLIYLPTAPVLLLASFHRSPRQMGVRSVGP